MFEKETLTRVSDLRSGNRITGLTPVQPGAPAAQTQAGAAHYARTSRTPTSALDSEALDKALDNLTAHVQNLHRSLQFSVDKGSGDTVVKVIDTETREVIRQIPSEELLAIAERLRETAGVLLEERA
ncbi:MAG: flagellar protein FlaG [Gammaproteobacteria bacterium]